MNVSETNVLYGTNVSENSAYKNFLCLAKLICFHQKNSVLSEHARARTTKSFWISVTFDNNISFIKFQTLFQL